MGGNLLCSVSGQSGADAFLQIILDYGVRISVQNKGCWSRLPSGLADPELRSSIQLGESAHPAATVCVADARAAPGRATPILPPALAGLRVPGWVPGAPGAAEGKNKKLPTALQVLAAFRSDVRPCAAARGRFQHHAGVDQNKRRRLVRDEAHLRSTAPLRITTKIRLTVVQRRSRWRTFHQIVC